MTAPLSQPAPLLTLRDALRNSTHARHAALDRALLPPGSSWTMARYAGFLRGTLAVLVGAETAIGHTLPAFAEAGGGRVERLRQDLRAVGHDPAVTAVPVPVELEAPAGAFGAAYVIEGSMLGGQYVARALERDLGLGAEQLTYLRPAGVAVGPRWSAFVAMLDAFGASATAADWRLCEAAAQAAFDAFAEAFRREALI